MSRGWLAPRTEAACIALGTDLKHRAAASIAGRESCACGGRAIERASLDADQAGKGVMPSPGRPGL